MLQTLLLQLQKQTCSDALPVYTAFDAKPVWEKCRTPFVVLGIDSLQTQAPLVLEQTQYYAFQAELSAVLLAPPETDTAELYQWMDLWFLPKMLRANATFLRFSADTPAPNTLLRRQSLTMKFQLSGIYSSAAGGDLDG